MSSYLTTSDVAKRLNVSLDTVRRWLRTGELKGSPFGRAGYRIEVVDFEEFFNRRRHAQSQQPRQSQAQDQEAVFPSLPSLKSSAASVEDMLNALGQQLRAPLTTAQGALQQARHLLQRARASSSSGEPRDTELAKLQEVLTRIERQVSEEMRLISNLLDASLIEANRLELFLDWLNLVDLVRETVSRQQDLAPQRVFQLALPADELVGVMADEQRIRQALTNYLLNAHRYSPLEQPIKIMLEVGGPLARISVKDSGPGIPDGDRIRIWQRFQRSPQPVNSAARAASGLGLGLYLTRAIIQQHHGTVGLDTVEGAGATFWFTLPLADD